MATPLNTSELENDLSIANKMLDALTTKYGVASTSAKTMTGIQGDIIENLKKENALLGKQQDIQSQIDREMAKFQERIKKSSHITKASTENHWKKISELRKKQDEMQQKSKDEEINNQRVTEMGLGKILDMRRKIVDMAAKDPWLLAITASLAILKNIWGVFKEIDKAAADFRKEMGTTRDYMANVDTMARKAAFELRQVGITAEIAYKSISAMAKVLGSSAYVTQGITENISLMQSQFGIAQATSADFLKNMAMAAGTIADSQTNMTLFTAKLSMAADTNLGEVMKDVSNASKASYSYISRSPMALIKASVEAQRLGTTLSKSAETSKQLLDFTSNIKAEMLASVLVGKSINLDKARDLAYSKDLRGLNREILRIAKEVDFNQLDPLQQDAVAKALGKSADEIAAMLQAEKQMADLEKSTDPAIRAKLKAYKEMMSATKARAEFEAKDLDTIIRIKNNAAATVAVSDAWKAITQRLAEAILPVIAKTLEFVAWLLSHINGKLLATVGIVTTLAAVVTAVVTAFSAFRKLTAVGASVSKGIMDKLAGSSTKKFFEGLSDGLKLMADRKVFIGILALGFLGVALIPFMIAVSKLKGLDWNSLGVAAAALVGFTAAVFGLGWLMTTGVGAIIFGAGILAFAAMGGTLLLLGKGAMAAGLGMEKMRSQLDSITNLSFTETITQVGKLAAAILALSETINNMPKLDIGPLSALSNMPAFQVNPPAAPITAPAVAGANSDVLNELKLFRKDLSSGLVRCDVYLNATKVSEELGKAAIFTGDRTPASGR